MYITCDRTLRLNSPAQWVYQYLSHHETFINLLPHETSFAYTDVGAKRSGGFYYNMTYSFMRMKMITINETSILTPNQQIVIETRGSLSGLTYFTLDAEDSGTRLTVRIEYKETPTVLDSFTPKFSTAVVHQLLDGISENAKHKLRCPDIERNLDLAGVPLIGMKQ